MVAVAFAAPPTPSPNGLYEAASPQPSPSAESSARVSADRGSRTTLLIAGGAVLAFAGGLGIGTLRRRSPKPGTDATPASEPTPTSRRGLRRRATPQAATAATEPLTPAAAEMPPADAPPRPAAEPVAPPAAEMAPADAPPRPAAEPVAPAAAEMAPADAPPRPAAEPVAPAAAEMQPADAPPRPAAEPVVPPAAEMPPADAPPRPAAEPVVPPAAEEPPHPVAEPAPIDAPARRRGLRLRAKPPTEPAPAEPVADEPAPAEPASPSAVPGQEAAAVARPPAEPVPPRVAPEPAPPRVAPRPAGAPGAPRPVRAGPVPGRPQPRIPPSEAPVFGERVPWPAGSEAAWRCEITWQSGYRRSEFRALVRPPGSRKRTVLATSPQFRNLIKDPADTPRPELAEAVRALMHTLVEQGWKPVRPGGRWYNRRFVWPGEGPPPGL